ncbi:ABC-2 type transport system permease protein [Methanofollis sp. W23]|uniref:ABC transporter permease n=1 Tax=Methanofollis sp. W23 TaxID=2817849 RepID=UPI001AE31662|nr:ABC transporter permease [Methanofollis sp. W23]MBP2146706.1 ABC-2 type transport system permease protein [Methanofollis sp. W23]
MRTEALRVIAAREFHDHVRSRRFLCLLGIMLVIAAVGLASGTVQYHKDLDDYNQARTAVGDEELAQTPLITKPSPLFAFYEMALIFSSLGAVTGIAMGFDLVTREKESKSLKILLSHPIYRDEVITGKALGGAAAIALAIFLLVGVSCAVLLMSGVVPDLDESIRILIFGLLSFLMIVSFFALALFFSTVTKTSGSALVSTLIVFITLSSATYLATSSAGVTLLIGEPPEFPGVTYDYSFMTGPNSGSGIMGVSDEGMAPGEFEERMEEYEIESKVYQGKRQAIEDTFHLISPDRNYEKLTFAVVRPGLVAATVSDGEIVSEDGLSALFALLGSLASNIVAILVFPAAFFGLSWIRFVREDIR